MKTDLRTSACFPFNLESGLCPLLNDADLLSAFYAEESLRHGIKNFCKKTQWPGKPAVGFAVDPAKLQELLLHLFNTPAARALLQKQSMVNRVTYLDNAVWQWFSVVNPALAQRVSDICVEVKDRLFLKPEALQKFLLETQASTPSADVVRQLALLVLAFAMLQPEDRYALGETFLEVFPDYAQPFGA